MPAIAGDLQGAFGVLAILAAVLAVFSRRTVAGGMSTLLVVGHKPLLAEVYDGSTMRPCGASHSPSRLSSKAYAALALWPAAVPISGAASSQSFRRSEERRVGKECRSGGGWESVRK